MPWSDVLGFALLAAIFGYGALKVHRANSAKNPNRVRLSGISLMLGVCALTIYAMAERGNEWLRWVSSGFILVSVMLNARPKDTFDAISRRGKRSE